MHWSVALPHQWRSASKNTAFKFNTSIYSMHSAEEYAQKWKPASSRATSLSDTAALLHGNASVPAGLEQRLGSRLISHYRRLMFLPGAYKSTRASSFHVRSGKLSCTSTSSLNSTCMFYMSVGVDEMGQSLYIDRSQCLGKDPRLREWRAVCMKRSVLQNQRPFCSTIM